MGTLDTLGTVPSPLLLMSQLVLELHNKMSSLQPQIADCRLVVYPNHWYNLVSVS